ncbi:hypothetical protein B0W48_07480 [Pseudoalteromonas aliena]|uniref:Uncharacterized protein n=1 Tax=Pseudoalteromonas aliena TaxID=247523 RepID=A0A1Q2GX06_9GAMM|nr:hypothetical protein [Pseudoalteromonas aliena]AQP99653.1 hypothetical protein B0W48_07480 [Pseudoalteromonas aliena]
MGARWFAMGKGVANSPERNQHQIDNPELDADTKAHYIQKYQHILAQGVVKCPPQDENSCVKGQRGR